MHPHPRDNGVLWHRLCLAGVLALVMLMASATAPIPAPAQGTPSVTLPTDSVRFAFFPCCPDQNFAFVAFRKGFFSDVGIQIVPEEGAHLTDPAQGTPAMQRGDYDMLENFIQGYLQTLNTFGMDIPPIAFHDIFLGISILKAPDNPAKTVQDYLDEGKSFSEAARMAVEQLRGQEVVTPAFGTVQPQQPVVYLSYAGMTYEDINLNFIDDTKIVELSTQPGRLKYAIPLGAGIIVQLTRNGWKPMIDTNIILKDDPYSDQATKLTQLVGSSGVIAQRKFIDSHHDTVLRFISAWFRTVDYVTDPANQEEALGMVADSVNATQGTKLGAEQIAGVYQVVDPLFPWDQQGPQLWDNEGAPFFVHRALKAQIQSLVDNSTLPDQQYDIDNFLVAEKLYREMKDLQQQADNLFVQASSLTGDQPLVDQAHKYYAWHDYLDAVRFLKAALGSQ
jgi:ABC-type nitrate/sulfonate/bicarbonate transport system substrate-binding protein